MHSTQNNYSKYVIDTENEKKTTRQGHLVYLLLYHQYQINHSNIGYREIVYTGKDAEGLVLVNR